MKNSIPGILYKCWRSSSPRAVFLLVHGLGAHAERWNFLADFLLGHNISSYAIELRGFGETEHPKGHIDTFTTYFNDLEILSKIIRRENRGKKIFLTGESLGGLISFLAAAKNPALADGLVCISPAFSSRMKLKPVVYAQIALGLIFKPSKKINMPFTSEMCTRDKNYIKVMDEDKREHRVASAKLLFETAKAQMRAGAACANIKIPILFLLSGEDKLVNPKKSKKIFEQIGAKDKTLIEYPGMYHALSVEFGREKVFRDMLDWVNKRI